MAGHAPMHAGLILAHWLGHVQRALPSRLQAGIFANASSFQPDDGHAVASREDGGVPCSEVEIDAATPLYSPSSRIDSKINPVREQELIWASGGFLRATSISIPSSSLFPHPTSSPACSARRSKRRATMSSPVAPSTRSMGMEVRKQKVTRMRKSGRMMGADLLSITNPSSPDRR